MKAAQALTLQAHLDARPITVAEAVRLARHLAELLDAARHEGAKHCNIKPSNVLLARDGLGRLILKAGGACTTPTVSERLGNQEFADDETLTSGALRDAMRYMSPEECRGESPDARSDVYSLGVILYEMLVGRVPFDGESAREIARKHIEESPSFVSFSGGDAQVIAPFVMRALHKNPASRPTTAEAARGLRHLEYLVGGEALSDEEVAPDDAAQGIALQDHTELDDTGQNEGIKADAPQTHRASALIVASSDALSDATATIETPAPHADLETSHTSLETPHTHAISAESFSNTDNGSAADKADRTADDLLDLNWDEELTREVRREDRGAGATSASRVNDLSALPQPSSVTIQHRNFSLDGREPNHNFSSILVTISEAQRTQPPSRLTRPSTLVACVLLASVLATFGALWLSSPDASSRASGGGSGASGDVTPDSAAGAADTSAVNGSSETLSSQPSSYVRVPSDGMMTATASPEGKAGGRTAATGVEPRATLRRTFDAWVVAAKSRNVDQQMSFYMPQLNVYYGARNVSRAAARRTRLRRTTQGDVKIGDPEISISADGRTATMSFVKTQTVNGKRTEVVQELRWVLTDEGWKISSERDLRAQS